MEHKSKVKRCMMRKEGSRYVQGTMERKKKGETDGRREDGGDGGVGGRGGKKVSLQSQREERCGETARCAQTR